MTKKVHPSKSAKIAKPVKSVKLAVNMAGFQHTPLGSHPLTMAMETEVSEAPTETLFAQLKQRWTDVFMKANPTAYDVTCQITVID